MPTTHSRPAPAEVPTWTACSPRPRPRRRGDPRQPRRSSFGEDSRDVRPERPEPPLVTGRPVPPRRPGRRLESPGAPSRPPSQTSPPRRVALLRRGALDEGLLATVRGDALPRINPVIVGFVGRPPRDRRARQVREAPRPARRRPVRAPRAPGPRRPQRGRDPRPRGRARRATSATQAIAGWAFEVPRTAACSTSGSPR